MCRRSASGTTTPSLTSVTVTLTELQPFMGFLSSSCCGTHNPSGCLQVLNSCRGIFIDYSLNVLLKIVHWLMWYYANRQSNERTQSNAASHAFTFWWLAMMNSGSEWPLCIFMFSLFVRVKQNYGCVNNLNPSAATNTLKHLISNQKIKITAGCWAAAAVT